MTRVHNPPHPGETLREDGLPVPALSLSRRYPVQLQFSDEDAGCIATFPDLPGCSAWALPKPQP